MIKPNDQILEEFILAIRRQFPEVSEKLDEWMEIQEWDHEDQMYCATIEHFSQITTDSLKENNVEKAERYLDFMSKRLERATEIEKVHIDTCFVEHLMWDDFSDSNRRKCWALMPQNLQKLYYDFWNRKLYHE